MKFRLPAAFALVGIAFGMIAGASSVQAEDDAILFPLLDPEKGERYKRPTAAGKKMPAMQRIDAGLTPYAHEEGGIMDKEEYTTHAMSLHIIKIDRLFKLRAGHGLAPNPSKIVADEE